MSRKRLALLLLVPALVIVLLVGLTRDRETNEGAQQRTSTTLPLSDLSIGGPTLQAVEEVVEVPADAGCTALTTDPSPSCEGYDVLGQEVAWLIEQSADEPPIASFLRRLSPTSWTRVLRAGGTNVEHPFERVNVRVADLTGDGAIEIIFAYHFGPDTAIDVVAADGVVLLHRDLPAGHAFVDGEQLVTYLPDQGAWRKDVLGPVDGALAVITSAIVEGPPEGNL